MSRIASRVFSVRLSSLSSIPVELSENTALAQHCCHWQRPRLSHIPWRPRYEPLRPQEQEAISRLTTRKNYEDGPELALPHYPEVLSPQPSLIPLHAQPYPAYLPPPSTSYAGSPALSTNKAEGSLLPGPPVAHYQQHPHYYNALASQDGIPDGNASRGQRLGPFGCTMLVFWLSAVIAVLSVAVIGLAAGTGVEANRANNAEKSLARLSGSSSTATATAAAASTTSTSFASIDMGCSNVPDTVTGSRYTSFERESQHY